jgi:MarR family
MSGEGLVELARRYVALSDELETVRGEIARAVLNGEGPKENPIRPARSPSGSQHPAPEEAEHSILSLLEKQPNLGTSAIAKAMSARTDTTTSRLKRLRQRGQIAGGGHEGWRLAAPA